MGRDDDTRESADGEGAGSRGEIDSGTLAGDYRVESFLAQGGCGAVYRARHQATGRLAALKVLHASLVTLPKMVERFARETQVLNLLRHPNIIEVYQVGRLPDGRPYFAMEYVEGRTLATILEQQGRMSPVEALEILTPVCSTLEAAHAAGVIHRDVKAGNIMVIEGAPPVVKLLDFGIAKLVGPDLSGHRGLTSEGRQVGTLTIMAPEQLVGGSVDHRIDIYALGALLYRMLTGRQPFGGRSMLALVQQHLEEPAPRPSQRVPLSPALDAIVLRCMEKNPDNRYPSVREFLLALRAACNAGRRRDSRPLLDTRGVALCFEVRVASSDDEELDEALSDDLGRILDLIEEALGTEGFLIASATDSQVLGVRILSLDPARELQERAGAFEIAWSILRAIEQRPDPDPRIEVSSCVNVGDVVTRFTSKLEVIGGDLLRVGGWTQGAGIVGLCATREAAGGLAGFALQTAPGGLVRVSRAAARRSPVPAAPG